MGAGFDGGEERAPRVRLIEIADLRYPVVRPLDAGAMLAHAHPDFPAATSTTAISSGVSP